MSTEKDPKKPSDIPFAGNIVVPIGQRPFRTTEEMNFRKFGYRRIEVVDGELIAIC